MTIINQSSVYQSINQKIIIIIVSASDWLERLGSEMTYNVLMGTLNPTHSLTFDVCVVLLTRDSF